MALYLLLMVIASICISGLQGGKIEWWCCLISWTVLVVELTGRGASGSSLPLCGWSNQTSTSGNCSATFECHLFQTNTGGMICAPNTDCSYYETCYTEENIQPCSTNTSVCVTNSLCKTAICLPIVLNSICVYNQCMYSSILLSMMFAFWMF